MSAFRWDEQEAVSAVFRTCSLIFWMALEDCRVASRLSFRLRLPSRRLQDWKKPMPRWDTIEPRSHVPRYGQYDADAGQPISTFERSSLSGFGAPGHSHYDFGGCLLRARPHSGFGCVRADFAGVLLLAFLGLRGQALRGQAPTPPATSPPAPPAAPVVHPTAPRFVVVLDAAHGGDDSGGQLCASVAEKSVTLSLSVRLRSLLAARGFQVVTTREGNVTLDADARAQIANHAQAAACISFHATESGSGVHLFTSSLAATQPTRFLAWKTAQSA